MGVGKFSAEEILTMEANIKTKEEIKRGAYRRNFFIGWQPIEKQDAWSGWAFLLFPWARLVIGGMLQRAADDVWTREGVPIGFGIKTTTKTLRFYAGKWRLIFAKTPLL